MLWGTRLGGKNRAIILFFRGRGIASEIFWGWGGTERQTVKMRREVALLQIPFLRAGGRAGGGGEGVP